MVNKDGKQDIYNQDIMRYVHDKTNYGEIKNPSFASKRSNVACGDSLSVTGIIKDNIITDIKFTGSGCMISQASAAMLMEKVKGKQVSYAEQFSTEDVKKMLGIELGFLRSQCAELPLKVLQEALKSVKKDA